MSRLRVRDILHPGMEGESISVSGWIRTRRDSKGGFSFLELNDGSCVRNLQVVADSSLPNYASEVAKLHPGASVRVEGSVARSIGAGQSLELKAVKIDVIGWSDPESYPLGKQRVSFEKLRELAHLRPRTATFGAVARLRNRLSMAVHEFLQARGFLYLQTPIVTCSDCEGAGAMFRVTTIDPALPPTKTPDGAVDYSKDFFARKAFLTVSGQLEAETHACALGAVYTFGPTFRAEPSTTRRHLAEFWMVEPEMAFADLADDADLAEDFLRHLFKTALNDCAEDLTFFDAHLEKGLRKKLETLAGADSFARISYTEAVDILNRSGRKFEFEPRWGADLQTEHERHLTEVAFNKPVVVTDYPKEIKAFYMRRNDDGRTVAAMDVLVPGVGEIIGGSQREERADILLDAIRTMGHDPSDYWWYADLRRFGTVPHAGFGLGFERLIQFCSGMENIRDAIPFPRTPRNAEF